MKYVLEIPMRVNDDKYDKYICISCDNIHVARDKAKMIELYYRSHIKDMVTEGCPFIDGHITVFILDEWFNLNAINSEFEKLVKFYSDNNFVQLKGLKAWRINSQKWRVILDDYETMEFEESDAWIKRAIKEDSERKQ